MNEVLEWLPDGSPYSPRFADIYHSRSGGLNQAQRVFLAGCDLPGQWQGQTACTVLETGFGLGVNFLTTWAAWEADPQRCARLDFVSIEAYPVAAEALLRSAQALDSADAPHALQARVQSLAPCLARVWQGGQPGIQHFDFAQGQVRLTLAVGDVRPMLAALDCTADAVFLDGFSPACNPAMWSADTLQAVARHCRVGTRLASYTTQAQVRQTLTQLGFDVQRCAGLPPKRHRLQAVYLGTVGDAPAGDVSSQRTEPR